MTFYFGFCALRAPLAIFLNVFEKPVNQIAFLYSFRLQTYPLELLCACPRLTAVFMI